MEDKNLSSRLYANDIDLHFIHEISTIANEVIDVNVFHSTLRFHFKNGVNFIPTILPKFLEFTNLKTLNFKC